MPRASSDFRADMVGEIERFFVHYDEPMGRTFRPLGRQGPERAGTVVEAGIRAKRNVPGCPG